MIEKAARVTSMDVARGIAIFGILIANIPAFGQPVYTSELFSQTNFAGWELTLEQWRTALVSGKFRGMLSMLFGAGMYILYMRSQSNGSRWPGNYMVRNLGLLTIGLFHAIFIWYGDILVSYALVAFVGALLIHQSRHLKTIMIGLGIVAFLIACGTAIGMLFAGLGGVAGDAESEKVLPEFMTRFFSVAGETSVFASGAYWEQLVFRLIVLATMILSITALGPILLLNFLFGAWMCSMGLLRSPSSQPRLRNKVLGIAFGIGLPLNLSALFIENSGALIAVGMFIELFGSAFLAAGLLLSIAVAVEQKWLAKMLGPISNVGKMALSNYLLQSLLLTCYFYSWGGRQYGKWDSGQLLLLVPLIWLINIIFSHFWLSKYRMGPVEWAWRSAVAKNKLPIRKVNSQPAEQLA